MKKLTLLTLITLISSQLHLQAFNPADVERAIAGDTNLENADFTGADIALATDLKDANLTGALYDNATKFPHDFEPEEYGMVNINEKQTTESASQQTIDSYNWPKTKIRKINPQPN